MRKLRHKRARARVHGTKNRPRLSVFRSNKHIYAQLIDDEKGETLVSASDLEIPDKKIKVSQKKFKEKFRPPKQASKTFAAYKVGKILAQKAKKKKISKVVFDRSGYKYHGRVKALAEGAREGGLEF